MSTSKKFTYPLLETIRLKDGMVFNLEAHQDRLNRSYRHLFGKPAPFSLEKILAQTSFPGQGLYKIRFLYGQEDYATEILPYEPKTVKSLKVIEANELIYNLKFTDRTAIDRLMTLKGKADDILIVKHGMITDTSFGNIAFYDGKRWLTPARPLLNGTMRRTLIRQGRIFPVDIRIEDLKQYTRFKIFNAMRPLEEQESVGTDGIIL